VADIHADERARQQRADPRHRAARDARPHDPEARVVDEHVGGVTGEFGGCDDVFIVFRQRDFLHDADVDVLELDLGLARFEPFACLEADRDGRPLRQHRLHREPDADQHGDDGHQPDPLDAPALARHGDGFG
jgi:hypothetical protein